MGVLVIEQGESRRIMTPQLRSGAARRATEKRHLVPRGVFPDPAFLRPLMQVLGTPYSISVRGQSISP